MKALKVKLEQPVPRVKPVLLAQWVPWVLWVPGECRGREAGLGRRALRDNEVHTECQENPGRWVLLGFLALLVFQEILG